MESLIRIGEASRLLGVHPVTLKRWEAVGLVQPLRGPGGARYFRFADIERLRAWREPKPDNGRGCKKS